MKYICIILGIMAMGAFGFSLFMAGYEYYQHREIIKEKEIIVDRWHEPEVKIVETLRYEPYAVIPPNSTSDWTSLDELNEFLAQDNTDEFISQSNEYMDGLVLDWDCDNKVILLMNSAEIYGKRLSFVWLSQSDALKWFNINGAHAVCGAVVGNSYYYIDAETERVVKVGDLD